MVARGSLDGANHALQDQERKPRGIPINRDLYEALVALAPVPAECQGLVFARQDGTAWGQIRTAFTTALTRAGIEAFRFHDLRHTFASHFLMRGGSLYDLKEILGHSDIKMTMRYAHLSPQHLRAGMERMEGLTRRPMIHTEPVSDVVVTERVVR